jgi:hypothetical protein
VGYRINQRALERRLGIGQEVAPEEVSTITRPLARTSRKKWLVLTMEAIPDNIAGSTFRKGFQKQ